MVAVLDMYGIDCWAPFGFQHKREPTDVVLEPVVIRVLALSVF